MFLSRVLTFSGDTVPSYKSVYRRHDGRTVNRRSVKENDMLKFLRSASHNFAIDRLRQAALYPVQIPEAPPKKQPWENFAKVLYTYFIHYCSAEGLTISHVMTRQVRNNRTCASITHVLAYYV